MSRFSRHYISPDSFHSNFDVLFPSGLFVRESFAIHQFHIDEEGDHLSSRYPLGLSIEIPQRQKALSYESITVFSTSRRITPYCAGVRIDIGRLVSDRRVGAVKYGMTTICKQLLYTQTGVSV